MSAVDFQKNPPIDNGILITPPLNDPAWSKDQRHYMLPYALVFQIVTTLLLLVRLASRFNRLGGQLGLDDLFVVFGWLFALGVTTTSLYGNDKFGWNKHMMNTDPSLWWKSALVCYIAQFLFMLSLMFTKLSILMFYRRLVKGTYNVAFKWALWFGMFLALVSTIVPSALLLTSCTPFKVNWMQWDLNYVYTQAYKFKCRKFTTIMKIGRMTGTLSVITDFYSIALPAILVMQLNFTRRQRWGLLCVFAVGLFVVIAGGVRTYYLSEAYRPIADKTWLLFNVWIASMAEAQLAIICACAPSLKTVFAKFFQDLTTRGGSKNISKESSQTDSENSYPSQEKKGSVQITFGSKSTNSDRRFSSFGSKFANMSFSGNRRHNPESELTSFAEAHTYGTDNYLPIAEAYTQPVMTHFDSKSSQDIHKPVAKPTTQVRRQDFSAFDFSNSLQSPPPQYTSPTLPNEQSKLENNSLSANKNNAPETDSFILFDPQNGSDRAVHVQYPANPESTSSSSYNDLSFPHMNPVISRTQSLKDAAELARVQALKHQTTSQRFIESGTQTHSLSHSSKHSIIDRPATANAASPSPSYTQHRGSVRNAVRQIGVDLPQRRPSNASQAGSATQRIVVQNRGSISHISDASDSEGESTTYNSISKGKVQPRRIV